MSGYCCSDTQTATVLQINNNIACQIKHIMTMKNIVVVLLFFISISLYAKPKKIVKGALIGPDSTWVTFKDGSSKNISTEDFYENYEVRLQYFPGGTVVSGTSEAPCLGGVIFLTDSKYDADYVIRETTRNDYDCTMRIVNRSSMNCDEWQITTDRGYADHKVYISKDVSNYDYKVRIIR